MNRKKIWILVFVFVLVLAGAGIAYKNLDKFVDVDRLATVETTQGTQPTEDTQPAENTQPTQATTEETENQERPLAPDVTITDWDGKEVQLSAYFGKPMVLNFWASWCGPCQSEMPSFQKVYEELGDEVQFVMLNATGGRETLDSAMEFIREKGYTFPVFFDVSGAAAYTYGARSLPTTMFIDAEGRFVTYAVGAIPEEILREGIRMITE